MTSKPSSNDGECRKLQEFKDFLIACTTDSTATQNCVLEARSCMTRSNNETYPVSILELRAEVVATIWNHLSTKRCPQDFKLALIRAAVDEVERERKDNKVCDFKSASTGGDEGCDDADKEPAATLYDLIKLQKFSLNILEKFLTRLTDNSEANNLHRFAVEGVICEGNNCSCDTQLQQSTTSVHTYLAAAVKNKPRKMEDRHCCWPLYSDMFQLKSTTNKYSFYGVFDGHGGPLAAAYAAAQVPHLCAERLKKYDSSSNERMAALKESFIVADMMFAKKRISSGTTAVCVLHYRSIDNVAAQQLYIAWVGDSKALLVGRTKRQQLVRPHKPDCPDERMRIESNNSGAVMFVQGHWRVNGILNVSRSIGDFSVNSVIAEPDMVCVELMEDDDFLVIGTDGLWDYASEQEIASTVYEGLAKKEANIEELPKQLIDLAKRGDSQDNITVVIVLLRNVAKINTAQMSEKTETVLKKIQRT